MYAPLGTKLMTALALSKGVIATSRETYVSQKIFWNRLLSSISGVKPAARAVRLD
jgi:hypothetical protein